MAELCPECGVWPARPGGGVCVDCEADCRCDALVLDSGHCSECGAEIEPAPSEASRIASLNDPEARPSYTWLEPAPAPSEED